MVKKQFSASATNIDLYTHDYISGRSVNTRVKWKVWQHGWYIKNKFISMETTITCLRHNLWPCDKPCTKSPRAEGGHQLANSYWYLWQTALQLTLHQPNCESAWLGSVPSYSGTVQSHKNSYVNRRENAAECSMPKRCITGRATGQQAH